MITLTDGTQTLKGMEYRPIRALHTNLTPGTKVGERSKSVRHSDNSACVIVCDDSV